MKRVSLVYFAVYIAASVLISQPLRPQLLDKYSSNNNTISSEVFNHYNYALNATDIGRIAQEVWQDWSIAETQYINNIQKIYNYDNKSGMLDELICQDWIEDRWVNSRYFEYKYDKNNLLTKYDLKKWNVKKSKWEKFATGTYLNYNSYGNYGEETYAEKNGDKFEYKNKYEYLYDDDGKIIEMFSYYFEDNIWKPFDWYQYMYQESCLINSIGYTWNDSNYTEIDRMDYNYSQGCHEVILYSQFWWLYEGSPTEWVYSIWNGNNWEPSYFGQFDVDNCGITNNGTIYYNFDQNTMTWNGIQSRGFLNYNYNCDDINKASTGLFEDVRLTSGEYQNYENGDWVNSHRTWISYENMQLSIDEYIPEIVGITLEQNFPNPFNPSTTICFSILEDSHITLSIYDLSGNLINVLIDKFMNIGQYNIQWNGENLNGEQIGTGMYFYNLKSDKFSMTQKMILSK